MSEYKRGVQTVKIGGEASMDNKDRDGHVMVVK